MTRWSYDSGTQENVHPVRACSMYCTVYAVRLPRADPGEEYLRQEVSRARSIFGPVDWCWNAHIECKAWNPMAPVLPYLSGVCSVHTEDSTVLSESTSTCLAFLTSSVNTDPVANALPTPLTSKSPFRSQSKVNHRATHHLDEFIIAYVPL